LKPETQDTSNFLVGVEKNFDKGADGNNQVSYCLLCLLEVFHRQFGDVSVPVPQFSSIFHLNFLYHFDNLGDSRVLTSGSRFDICFSICFLNS